MKKIHSKITKIHNYKTITKIMNCANYVFLDEISFFKFNKISTYKKSKQIFGNVQSNFQLVSELIDKQDLLNAATILRTTYENIVYIISTSFDKNIRIDLNTNPRDLRKVLEDNCNLIFSSYFSKEDFDNIYSHLCKIVHPCSLKELMSLMNTNFNYKRCLLNNLKYTMLIIEYMYLNFLNKMVGNEESKLDTDFIQICTYVNLENVLYLINIFKNDKGLIKKYLFHSMDFKYKGTNQEIIKCTLKELANNKETINKNIRKVTKSFEDQIENSKYKELINEMLINN